MMYVREVATIQGSNQTGGPRCVNLEADSISYSSPEEADTTETPGSAA